MLRSLALFCTVLFSSSCGGDKNTPLSQQTKATRDTAQPSPPEHTSPVVPHQAFHDEAISLPPAVQRFVPAGYGVLDTATGNLNLDAYPDMVLVLRKAGEDTLSNVVDHPEPRPLLLLIGDAAGGYSLAARSDKAVYCIDCGGMMGDPFMGVTIKNGFFSVEHYGGASARWEHVVTFKYAAADQRWFLHKDGLVSFTVDAPDKPSESVKTTKDFGRVPFEAFDIYKE